MLNAGDVKGAIDKIGCNIVTTTNIIDIVTEKQTTRLQNLQREIQYLNSVECNNLTEIEQLQKRIKTKTEEIDKLNAQLQGIKERITENDRECPICLSEISEPIAGLKCCNNTFCMGCLTESLYRDNRCPMCRFNMTKDNMFVIESNVIRNNVKDILPSKIDALMNILKDINEDKNRRILIFSCYDQTFATIETRLKLEHILYTKLNGNSNHINNAISKFKDGKVKIMMLNSKNYGSGLNLQFSSDIIFYHKMTNDIESQVIGRAQRVGRNERLKVHYLCYENEMPIT